MRQLGRLGANFSIDPTNELLAAFLSHFEASTALFAVLICLFVYEKTDVIISLCQIRLPWAKEIFECLKVGQKSSKLFLSGSHWVGVKS